VDVAPTVLALAGVRAPASMQGRSLLPLLRRPEARWRKSILTEYFVDPPYPATQKWQSIRTERWKWIHYPELEGADELYDLRSDPLEMKNRIDVASDAGVIRELQSELRSYAL
jgi:N-acetylglucosamine-6-sulfatase